MSIQKKVKISTIVKGFRVFFGFIKIDSVIRTIPSTVTVIVLDFVIIVSIGCQATQGTKASIPLIDGILRYYNGHRHS